MVLTRERIKTDSARDRFVQIALGEVGKSYASHRDCSGFTAWVARQVGVIIPEGSVAQFYEAGHPAMHFADEPGLLHFWDTFGTPPGHVAIGIGGGRVVHAMNEQTGIVNSSLQGNMGGPYMGARRIFTEGAHPPAPEKPDGAGVPSGEGGAIPPLSTDKPRDRQRKREKDRLRRRRRKA